MENFTNETIDITQLPKFEAVTFTKLHPSYWMINLIQIGIAFALVNLGYAVIVLNSAEVASHQVPIGLGIFAFFLLVVFFSRIAFKKKGFAFRQHDVLFRHGIIATNTLVIPYNRIQHVALHEGVFSRIYSLAKIEIFTAGGSASDIEIPGIEKQQAENIKQLLMGKIQKEL
ncbi:PH domain-containing protein [Flavobacterium sp. CYK-4]|uniref:PH domain-containing protein n=1 Tax=Flavobacterium lotistagni TaxID=2709660 RepID=UPI00140C54BC|nr:PH domain-containing protein [Flavobacterium lotistagni]NHM07729.1 PH domain-containing protein [Flavobacterium lotistagni]